MCFGPALSGDEFVGDVFWTYLFGADVFWTYLFGGGRVAPSGTRPCSSSAWPRSGTRPGPVPVLEEAPRQY